MKWVKEDVIAKGEVHTVYLASPVSSYNFGSDDEDDDDDSSLPSLMAVKSAQVSDSGFLQKEAQVISNLQGCPHILKYYGEETVFEDEGFNMIYNVFLEYASGGSLHDLIAKTNNGCGLPESDVRRYTRSLLHGLHHIHERGYVHRDIKPMNILLVPSSTGAEFDVKIADFDCAKKMKTGLGKRTRDGRLIDVAGTPLYMSPESVNLSKQDSSADIWALGCVVAEMVSGKHVWSFESYTDKRTLLNKMASGLESPQIPSGMSEQGQDFLKRCFVKNSDYRWTADMLLLHPFVAKDVSHNLQVNTTSRIDRSMSAAPAKSSELSTIVIGDREKRPFCVSCI